MKLRTLNLRREVWGEHKDQVIGTISFDDPKGEITLNLKPGDCDAILQICAERLAEQTLQLAHEMSDAIKSDVLMITLTKEPTSANSDQS